MKWKHMSERADEIIVNYSQLNQDKKKQKPYLNCLYAACLM